MGSFPQMLGEIGKLMSRLESSQGELNARLDRIIELLSMLVAPEAATVIDLRPSIERSSEGPSGQNLATRGA